MKMFVIKKKSEKTGKEYAVLKIDFGYRVAEVFIDSAVMCELAGVDFKTFYSMKPGDKFSVKLGD